MWATYGFGSPRVAAAEAELLRTLNAIVEPAVRAGCGSPGLVPTGLIVIETTGAKSGRARRTPVLATILDGCVFVGTVRGDRSLWMKNLRAEPRARCWVAGRPRAGRARVVGPGEPTPDTSDLPPLARAAAEAFLSPATSFGWDLRRHRARLRSTTSTASPASSTGWARRRRGVSGYGARGLASTARAARASGACRTGCAAASPPKSTEVGHL